MGSWEIILGLALSLSVVCCSIILVSHFEYVLPCCIIFILWLRYTLIYQKRKWEMSSPTEIYTLPSRVVHLILVPLPEMRYWRKLNPFYTIVLTGLISSNSPIQPKHFFILHPPSILEGHWRIQIQLLKIARLILIFLSLFLPFVRIHNQRVEVYNSETQFVWPWEILTETLDCPFRSCGSLLRHA